MVTNTEALQTAAIYERVTHRGSTHDLVSAREEVLAGPAQREQSGCVSPVGTSTHLSPTSGDKPRLVPGQRAPAVGCSVPFGRQCLMDAPWRERAVCLRAR